VARVAAEVARRLARLLERGGLGAGVDPGEADPLADEQPLLAELSAASVLGRVASGRRAGQRVLRRGDRIDADDLPALEGPRCARANGVSLHANVAVPARDRRRSDLEKPAYLPYPGAEGLASARLPPCCSRDDLVTWTFHRRFCV